MNKRQKAIYNKYLSSNNRHILDCYKKPSTVKYQIFNKIYDDYYSRDFYSKDFKIIGYNTHMFTCGFITVKNGKACLVYFNPSAWGQIIYID